MLETNREPDIWQRLPVEASEFYAHAENTVRNNIATHIARQATAETLAGITQAALQITHVTRNFELWTQDWLSVMKETYLLPDTTINPPEVAPIDSSQLQAHYEEVIRAYQLLGVSQRQLAGESGITQSMLSRLENGRKQPTLPLLRLARTALLKIAKEQDISADLLFADPSEDGLR